MSTEQRKGYNLATRVSDLLADAPPSAPLANRDLAVRTLLEAKYPHGPECPTCTAGPSLVRKEGDGRFVCRRCREKFTLRSNTAMDGARTRFVVWAYAYRLWGSGLDSEECARLIRKHGTVAPSTAYRIVERLATFEPRTVPQPAMPVPAESRQPIEPPAHLESDTQPRPRRVVWLLAAGVAIVALGALCRSQQGAALAHARTADEIPWTFVGEVPLHGETVLRSLIDGKHLLDTPVPAVDAGAALTLHQAQVSALCQAIANSPQGDL